MPASKPEDKFRDELQFLTAMSQQIHQHAVAAQRYYADATLYEEKSRLISEAAFKLCEVKLAALEMLTRRFLADVTVAQTRAERER